MNQKSLPSLKSNLENISKLLQNSNPNALIQNMVSQNPEAKQLLESMQNSSMTPKQFVYNYAQTRGIDVNKFLNS